MRKKGKVAVLLATYNGVDFVDQQIESIFQQRGVEVDIFANDDCSKDSTFDKLKGYAARAQLNVQQVKCGGPGQNFFHLLLNSPVDQYDYVAFSDQDDIWQPSKLECAVAKLREQNADGYSSNVTAFWEDGERRLIEKNQPQKKYDFLFESAGPGCTFVLTKELALKLIVFLRNSDEGDLRQVTLHDWLIYAWARHNDHKWYIDSYSSLDYRQHGDNAFGISRSRSGLIKRWAMVSDGWYLTQAGLNARLINHSAFPANWFSRRSFALLLKLIFSCRQLRRRTTEALFLCAVLTRDYWKHF